MDLDKTLAIALALTLSAPALASDIDSEHTDAPKIGADIEIDPLAYALGGVSLHAGLHAGKTRFDLGVFALTVPVWLHGNEGLSRDGVGFGFKADRYFGRDNTGFHAGLNLDVATFDYQDDASGISVSQLEVTTGGRVGWRLQHKSGLYVNPWVGVVTPIVGGGDVAVAGEVFDNPAVQVFPTVHVGWRLR
jgi:hypothetical protein